MLLLNVAEFEALPGSTSFPDRTTVHCDKNPEKNRYPDIPCYDQTRVCLSTIDDIPGSDYINANHVVINDKQFISAQGPIQVILLQIALVLYVIKTVAILYLANHWRLLAAHRRASVSGDCHADWH